jgi:hypothetical protein
MANWVTCTRQVLNESISVIAKLDCTALYFIDRLAVAVINGMLLSQ